MIKKLWIFTKFQLKLMMRDYKGAIVGFLVPVLSFIIFGNLFSQTDMGGINIVSYLIPAFIIIIIINALLLMFGQYYASYKESGTLLKYKLLGLPDGLVTLAIFLPTLLFQFAAIIFLVIIGKVTQGVLIPWGNMLSIAVAFIIVNFYQYSLSLLLQSFVKNSASYNSLSMLLFNYQMFLGGLTFPPELFPTFLMKIVQYFNPIYYGLIMFRGVWTDQKNIISFGKEAFILITIGIIFMIISYFLNKRKEF